MVAAPPAAAAAMRRGFLVPEIRPLDQYDGARARSAASLAWAIATGYGGAGNVPEELRDPFYTDQYEQEHIKPPVTRLLVATDIYCRAWRHALGPPEPPAAPPADNGALLALLARRGLPPTFQDAPVREADLQHKPIKMGAHLALIDSLMVAFVTEATRGLGPPPGTPPGPNAWEQKILAWLDRVNRKLQESTEKGGGPQSPPPPDGPAAPPACGHKIRYRRDPAPPRRSPRPPPLLGLQDLASGGALAAAIHYYCPQALRLEEVFLGEPVSVAESLHNLGLVREFSLRHLGTRCPLALEDLLYMAPPLRLNVGAFLAELFLCFEVLRPPFVRPRDLGGALEAPAGGEAPTPKSSSPGFSFRHPLLQGGQPPGILHPSPSLPHEGAFGKGWGKKPLSHPLSHAVSFSIPFGLDSDVDIVMGNPVGAALARSASTDSLAPPAPRFPPPPHTHPSPPPLQKKPLPNGPPAPQDPPTIEQALRIIHSSERLLPDGAPDAFYLHSPGPPPAEIRDPPAPPLPPTRPMTNFAERKKKLEEAAGSVGGGVGGGGGGGIMGVSPPTPSAPPQDLGTPPGGGEGLSARLEAKRRAIEAQKRRLEAALAKHRQRLGRGALLRLARGGAAPPRHEEEEEGEEEEEEEGRKDAAPPGGYEAAVAELSSALSALQADVERLSRQQRRLLGEQRPPPSQAWVIPLPKTPRGGGGGTPPQPTPPIHPPTPPPPKTPTPSSPARQTGGSAPSRKPPPPTGGHQSAPPRSPRRARPAELRLPPLTRVLTPPSDVDTLPHLRRFSPSQVPVQTRSSIHFSEEEEEEEEGEGGGEEAEPPPPPPVEAQGNLRPPGATRAAGDGTSDASSPGELAKGLLGNLGAGEEEEEEEEEEGGEGDSLEGSPPPPPSPPHPEVGANAGARANRGSCTGGPPAEAPVGQRLREEQNRRREEEAARVWPEPPRPPEEEGGPRRGGFTRQEHERRQQLKLMAELEKVLRPPRAPPRGPPRAPPRGPPRPRPRCCDDSALARSPPRGVLGARLSRIYSQSTLALASVGSEGGGAPPAGRGTSRAGSPSGPMSPGRPPPGREREWENEAGAPPPPGPDYSGPRLYKEPSAKSNKPIIHNALAHCCLAGRVNEPLKSRVLEEVEKSKANHFLILFREGSCQFRALYTVGGGDPPELRRLAGAGPRAVPLPQVGGLYKYLSDRRGFARLPASTLSPSVDAFTLQGPPRRAGPPRTSGHPPKAPGSPPKPNAPPQVSGSPPPKANAPPQVSGSPPPKAPGTPK